MSACNDPRDQRDDLAGKSLGPGSSSSSVAGGLRGSPPSSIIISVSSLFRNRRSSNESAGTSRRSSYESAGASRRSSYGSSGTSLGNNNDDDSDDDSDDEDTVDERRIGRAVRDAVKYADGVSAAEVWVLDETMRRLVRPDGGWWRSPDFLAGSGAGATTAAKEALRRIEDKNREDFVAAEPLLPGTYLAGILWAEYHHRCHLWAEGHQLWMG